MADIQEGHSPTAGDLERAPLAATLECRWQGIPPGVLHSSSFIIASARRRRRRSFGGGPTRRQPRARGSSDGSVHALASIPELGRKQRSRRARPRWLAERECDGLENGRQSARRAIVGERLLKLVLCGLRLRAASAARRIAVTRGGYARIEHSHLAVDGWNRYWQHLLVALPGRLSPVA